MKIKRKMFNLGKKEVLFSVTAFLTLAVIVGFYFMIPAAVKSETPKPKVITSHINDKPYSLADCSRGINPVYAVGVTVDSNDPWTPILLTNSPWLTIVNFGPGAGNGFFEYTVEKNLTGLPRSAQIAISGTLFTVTQSEEDNSKPCPIQPSQPSFFVSKFNQTIPVDLIDPLLYQNWQVVLPRGFNWITVSPDSGNGSGRTFAYFSYNSGDTRMTAIKFADRHLPVIQQGE